MTAWRDIGCGELRPEHVGSQVTVAGWTARRRDHGGLVFVDLRDSSGLCQLVINPEQAPEAHAAAHDVRNEFVLQATGAVVRRAPEAVNPNLPTGDVEIQVEKLRTVSRSTPLPFQLDEENVDETLRLRYRWLDLRRPKLQRNIRLRGRMVGTIRRVMEEAGFRRAVQLVRERVRLFGHDVEAEHLDRDETIARGFIRPEDRAQRANADLMQHPERAECGRW